MVRRLVVALAVGVSSATDDMPPRATTPPMGFNTWNHFGCRVSAQVLMDTADAFVSLGLAKAGYTFINSDDCWMDANRSADTHQQVPQAAKFPNGMRPVADYIHSKGLKMGECKRRRSRLLCSWMRRSARHCRSQLIAHPRSQLQASTRLAGRTRAPASRRRANTRCSTWRRGRTGPSITPRTTAAQSAARTPMV
jgi:hypothetical protein